jgi:HSP20 family protein
MRHPFEEMQTLQRQMNALFEQSVRGAYGDGEASQRVWAPAVDVVENEREIVLHAELPGLCKEDIDIQLTGETLTIRGERPQTDERGENFHRIERNYGAFGRAFEIETPIDAANVNASYEEGVLTVRLPKQERVHSRQIPIQTK